MFRRKNDKLKEVIKAAATELENAVTGDPETIIHDDFYYYWSDSLDGLVQQIAEYCAEENAAPGASLWLWEFASRVQVGNPGGAVWVLDVDDYVQALGREAFQRYLNGETRVLDTLSINIMLAIGDICDEAGVDF